MKKYVILIPIYNDRESLTKLIENINSEIEGSNSDISIIVVNDASSQQIIDCLLYTSPSPRDVEESRMPSSA